MARKRDYEYVFRREMDTTIYATCDNGYSGRVVLHGDGDDTRYELYAYFPGGTECLHSYSSNVKTYEELCECLEGLPEMFTKGGE